MQLIYREEKKNYSVYKVCESALPDNTFIICHESAEKILYRPHIAGRELQSNMEKVAEIFMDAIGRMVLNGKRISQISELVFLAGGIYYQLNYGFKKNFRQAIPQCFLGIKRQRIEGSEGEFTAVATYENFESLPDNATVIIGDTIATGATLQKGIYHLLDAFEERNYTLENLVACSLACSVNGAQIMKEIERRIKRDFPEANVYLFVAEELFHLMPDGTDLRFLYDDCIMPAETKERINRNYGDYLGREMKCAVFDWGTRCKNPIKHYHEFLEFADTALKQDSIDSKSVEVLERMKKETKEALANLETVL